jgi:tripartite ATP-independent transporter DctM subunit
MASGGLDILIPPSGLAVLLGVKAKVSIAKLLIGAILPGLLMACFYAVYIVVLSTLRPHLAPVYPSQRTSWGERLRSLHFIASVALVVFFVTGVIYLGIATPTEAAALGTGGAFIVAAIYRGFNLNLLREVVFHTGVLTSTILMIVAGAAVFGQVLVFSGTLNHLVQFATGLPVPPIAVVIVLQLVVLAMGMFMEAISIMMITMPIYIPIVTALGLDPVWFAIITLVNIELGGITPPFGMILFAMKSVAPAEMKMRDLWAGALPFVVLQLVLIGALILFPPIALFLPNAMR